MGGGCRQCLGMRFGEVGEPSRGVFGVAGEAIVIVLPEEEGGTERERSSERWP